MAGGLVAGAALVIATLLWIAGRGTDGLFNDFYGYWAGARILNQGGDPYDLALVARTQQAEGIHALIGGGYSYPPLFAELLRPIGAMPPRVAALLFAAVSVGGVVVAGAILVATLEPRNWIVAVIGGLGTGLFPPLTGSLYFGQANLVVLPLIAWTFARMAAAPGALGIAAAVKLYPVSGFLALFTQGRRGVRLLFVSAVTTGLFVFAPFVSGNTRHFFSSSVGLLTPDPFWSNQSVNGWVSRLALASELTRPPLPGLPVAPVMAALVVVLLVATCCVLALARDRSWRAAFALALWFGIVAAPKNSLWNLTPLLVCFAFAWPRTAGRRLLLILLAAGYALIVIQAEENVIRDWIYAGGPALSWFSSLGLYGALVLGAVLVRLLLAPRDAAAAPTA